MDDLPAEKNFNVQAVRVFFISLYLELRALPQASTSKIILLCFLSSSSALLVFQITLQHTHVDQNKFQPCFCQDYCKKSEVKYFSARNKMQHLLRMYSHFEIVIKL